MKDLKSLANVAVRNVGNQSPTILATIGVVGTIATAVLASKATVRAVEVLDSEPKKLDNRSKFYLLWKLYIPAVASGTFTCAAIIGANRVSTKRAAAIATAYSISEKAYTDYKSKVIDKLGEKKEKAIHDEISQEKVLKNSPSREVIITDGGEVLCYDSIGGRYFKSTMETILGVQNKVNSQILREDYCSLYEFYSMLGLSPTPFSSEVGWNTDMQMDITFSSVLTEDDRPAIAMNFRYFPIRGFQNFDY